MKQITLEVPDLIPDDQYSREFLQGMLNRMAQGFFTYGHVKDFYPNPKDAIGNAYARLRNYGKDGNKEWLMDAANFLMIEFAYPRHLKAHFRATSPSESPGTWEGDVK